MEVLFKWAASGKWDSLAHLAESPLIRWSLLVITLMVLNQILVHALGDLLLGIQGGLNAVAPERRMAARRHIERSGTALSRTILSLGLAAYFFVVTRFDLSWFDPLYRDSGSAPVLMNRWLPFYCELQAARFVFETFITPDFGFGWIAASVIRRTHLIICLMLIFIQRAGDHGVSLVYLVFLTQMDMLDTLDNFKLTHTLPFLQYAMSWRAVSIIWAVFRICIPIYAVYAGHLGMLAGRMVFAMVIGFQIIVWLQLPSDPPYVPPQYRQMNSYQTRMAKRRYG